MIRLFVSLVVVSTFAVRAADSFLRDGDYWVMVGDSITNTGTFEQLTARVLSHFHPEASIRLGKVAVNGVTADFEAKVSGTPTVVSIMLGMNDVIHRHHPFTPDPAPYAERYRASITQKVRQYREQGATVVLLTPTYTDERLKTAFENAMTRRLLEAFGQVVREVAAAEGCVWLPVGEEFEAYQDSLGFNQFLRHDGVHPYGYGQYQIARTLWRHLNLRGDLSLARTVTRDWTTADARMRLAGRFMHTPEDGITLLLSSEREHDVTVTWSLGQARGSAVLKAGKEPLAWQPPIPREELTLAVGDHRWLIVDLADDAGCSVYVIDLSQVQVLKPVDGVLAGTVPANGERPEGATVGTWQIREVGKQLWISGEVKDGELNGEAYFPFGRDAVHVWLDLRPAERFGDPSLDAEVSLGIVAVEDEPHFTVTHIPWINGQMGYAMSVGGNPVDGGYAWHLGLTNRLSTSREIDIRKVDYYGFNLLVVDHDVTPKEMTTQHYAFPPALPDPATGVPMFTIVDRRGTFPGATTTKLAIFGP